MAGKVLVLMAVVAAAFAASATAATSAAGPDASKMTLQAADFPGSHAQGQWVGDPNSAFPAYERDIKLAKPFGRSHYIAVASLAFLAGDATSADQLYRVLGHRFSQKSYRSKFVRNFLPISGVAKVGMIKPRALGVHDSSMEIGFLVHFGKATLILSMSLLRLDRVVVMNVATGVGSQIYVADAMTLANLTAGHAGAALVPIEIAVPTITGSAQQGATLTASTGGWEDVPTAFAYQWERCDAGGANCAAVPGATASTYPVTAADAGATLRVDVTATNRFGSVSAESNQTSAVT